MKNTLDIADKNKDVIRKLYDQVLNGRHMELLSDIISKDFTSANGKKGSAGFQESVTALINALPDVRWNIETLISEGDNVVIKWTLTGTHTGQFRHIAATGKRVTNDGIGFFEMKNGTVVNARVFTDRLGFFQDIGVLPANDDL